MVDRLCLGIGSDSRPMTWPLQHSSAGYGTVWTPLSSLTSPIGSGLILSQGTESADFLPILQLALKACLSGSLAVTCLSGPLQAGYREISPFLMPCGTLSFVRPLILSAAELFRVDQHSDGNSSIPKFFNFKEPV